MKISDSKYFKLKIEDVKYIKDNNGDLLFKSWTGYGPIQIPFGKTVFLKRGTRLPKFTMMYGKTKVLHIDVTKYLKNHVSYLQDKEETSNMTTSFDDFEKKKGEQLKLF